MISYLSVSKSDLTLLAVSGYKSLNYILPILKNTSSLGLVSKEAVVSGGHIFKNFSKTMFCKFTKSLQTNYSTGNNS